MTPRQIALVQDSFARVAPIAGDAADIFYARLFEAAPAVRSLFPDDMSEQKDKLMAMLGVAVNGLSDLDAILPAVRALGVRHRQYGAVPEHYEVVGETLLHTLAQGLGDAFTPDVEAAWTQTYAVLADIMVTACEGDER